MESTPREGLEAMVRSVVQSGRKLELEKQSGGLFLSGNFQALRCPTAPRSEHKISKVLLGVTLVLG